jgi:hypothetical protein
MPLLFCKLQADAPLLQLPVERSRHNSRFSLKPAVSHQPTLHRKSLALAIVQADVGSRQRRGLSQASSPMLPRQEA